MKQLSGEEKWNRMITIISFLLYTTYVILAVLSLYFTSGPTPEDVALGGKFMLALAALVIAQFFFSDLLARKATGETKNSWQEAVKQLLLNEVNDRAARRRK